MKIEFLLPTASLSDSYLTGRIKSEVLCIQIQRKIGSFVPTVFRGKIYNLLNINMEIG